MQLGASLWVEVQLIRTSQFSGIGGRQAGWSRAPASLDTLLAEIDSARVNFLWEHEQNRTDSKMVAVPSCLHHRPKRHLPVTESFVLPPDVGGTTS